MPFCCLSCSVLSFFVLSVENCLAGSSDHFRVTSREEALSLHLLQLCSSLPSTVHVLCFFSHRGPEVLQTLVPLQQRQRTARRVCWKNIMMKRVQKPTQLGAQLGQINCRHFMISLIYLPGTQLPEWMGEVWSAFL